jgi:RND family efflux transporter MFP subunit
MSDPSCRRFAWTWAPCCAAASAAIFAVAGCNTSHEPETAAEAPAEVPVLRAVVLEVQPVAWPRIVRSQGNLVADEVAVIGAKIAGRVEQINVDLGDEVAGGAEIASLAQEEFKLQVALAQAQLTQARSALGMKEKDSVDQLNPVNAPPVREARAVLDEAVARTVRLRPLRDRNAVTQEVLDAAIAAEGVADARYTSAYNSVLEKIAQIRVRAAELQLAEQRLIDSVILAPFEGLVQERHVARGSYVQIGDPIVTFVRTSKLRFQGTLPERHAVRLAIGQEVRLTIESIKEPRIATITRISPVIAEQSRSLMFEAELDNRDGALQTGLFAEAEVIVDKQSDAIAIPPSAIAEFAGAEKVWKVVDGMAEEHIVVTERRSDSLVEITEGLAAGDTILVTAAEGRVARVEPLAPNSSAEPVVLAPDSSPLETDDSTPEPMPADPAESTTSNPGGE